MKTITVDGLKVTMDERDADIVSRTIAKLQDALDAATDAVKLRDGQLSTLKKDSDVKDAKIATLEKQLGDAKLTPQKIHDAARTLNDTIARARKLLGDRLREDPALGEIDYKRQVVDAFMGDKAKDWSEDAIRASFELAATDAAPQGHRNQMDRVLGDGLSVHSSQDARDAAYEAMVKRMEGRWKEGKGKPAS